MTRSILATLACALLAAFGSEPGGPAESVCGDGVIEAQGEFELTASGPDVGVMCGSALFAGDGSRMQLLSTSDISNATFSSSFSSPPGPGTYSIVDFLAHDGGAPPSGAFTVWVLFDSTALETGMTSVTGMITIDASSATEISGSFEFSARSSGVPGTPSDHNVTGTFSAEAMVP